MNFKSLINKCLEFVLKRLVELSGIVLIVISLLLFTSLISYSPEDPNFIFPDNSEIKNLLGSRGSFVSDFFYQSVGLISLLFCFTILFTGIIIFNKKNISLIFGNFFYSIIYLLIGSFFFTTYNPESFWLVNNGNGGFVGKYLFNSFLTSVINLNIDIFFYILILLILTFFLLSINFNVSYFLKLLKKIFKNLFKTNRQEKIISSEINNDDNEIDQSEI